MRCLRTFLRRLRRASYAERSVVFPRDFAWGSGTSSYQIEGAWNADGKGESIWDHWAHNSGKVANGDNGDVACDHYNRFASDVELIKRLNLNSYRFSIAWPRVQPTGRGQYNQAGIAFYDRLIDKLLENGIDPHITLYHWDLPQALQAEFGGWASRDVCQYFADHSGKMVERFSDRVSKWSTHNEPWCTAYLGYAWGHWAPGVADEKVATQVHHNLLLSHGLAVKAARAAARRPIKIGIVLSLSNHEPLTPDDADKAAWEMRWQDGVWFDPLYRGTYIKEFADKIPDLRSDDLRIIGEKTDYLGVNFYFRVVHSKTKDSKQIHPIAGHEYTDMPWEVTPRSLYSLLTHISKNYGAPPIYITENGAAFKDVLTKNPVTGEDEVHDNRRLCYIRDHVEQVALAMKSGVNVKGYFAWSLMDNFEWNEGYSKRFGIVYVDYPTQRRIIKDSGKWYANLARDNAMGSLVIGLRK